MVDVVALVVNWSTPDDLLKCVTSADKYEIDLRWSIWQNQHDDPDIRRASEDVLRSITTERPRRVVAQWGRENHGHGYGTNRAARLAEAIWEPEFYFIVNPDTSWMMPMMFEFETFMRQNLDAYAVGPKQMDSQDKITAGGIIGPNDKPQHRYWHHPDPDNRLARDTVQCPTIAGAAMFVRRKDFFEYGGLLESAHYFSETWPCYHARAHGKTVWYYGSLVMRHEWHRSTPVGDPRTDGKIAQDRALFREMCDQHDPPILHD